MDRDRFNDVYARWYEAHQATNNSTWPARLENYGPDVAQKVLRSWMDMSMLLKEVKIDD